MADPVVFLPAFMCDARAFWPQIMSFSASRAVQIGSMAHADSIGALAQRVLDGAPKRFVLCGVGLGGMVAMEVLNRAPDRVSRLALISTTALPEPPHVAADREPGIIGVRNGRLIEVAKARIEAAGVGDVAHKGEVIELMLDMAEALGPDVFVRQSRALQRRPDPQRTLRKAKQPVLVMCGEEDHLYGPKRHEFLAELIPNAELKVISGGGHYLTLEHPSAVNHALKDFFDAPLVLR
ncbi:alpha/beta fold hydrolase [Vannielia litorea]|uniref:alpha/beta fold hydrolase n=1 Tax=Vannielia TaxID=2813041 RepID=UPI001C96E7B7|nr:alpha/beta hydrolase [Vannielia litorea]MBY6046406.1 alpha/beta hydrolase [Vannielia litorea]MBY6073819.1 alpha/beta hydrolase [Vannielia litorea]